MSEKLQKVLARAGLGSRRHMEQVITEGRVSINGQIAQLGDRVNPQDELRIDGRKVQYQIEREMRRRVLIYYKPEGEICSRHDPEGRPTAFDHLPQISHDRWIMVGRLDINSTGLLLFTNDGELANRLMHPSHEIEREYAVRVMGEVTESMKNNLLRGVQLEDGFAKFESLAEGGGEGFNRWYHVVVKEGRNREVRRLFDSQGLKVSRLLRVRYGVIHLPRELRTGRWLELDRLAIDQLAKSVDLRPRQQSGVQSADLQRRQAKMLDNPLPARKQPRQNRQNRESTSTREREHTNKFEQRQSPQHESRSPRQFDKNSTHKRPYAQDTTARPARSQTSTSAHPRSRQQRHDKDEQRIWQNPRSARANQPKQRRFRDDD